MISETSKQKRRRQLRRRQGLEALFPLERRHLSGESRARTAWLMVATHAYRTVSLKDDSDALRHARAELTAIIPRHASCGTCAVCQAHAYCVASFDSPEDEHAVAAACGLQLADAVIAPLAELCGTAGLLIGRAAELAFKRAGLTFAQR